MKQYTIHEASEQRGHSVNETFNNLSDAIDRLNAIKYSCRNHGTIIKEAVKSFTWEGLDQYNNSYRTEYKILKD